MPRNTMTYAESIEAVRAAIAKFPPVFKMRYGRLGVFRIEERASYVNEAGVVMLYVYVKSPPVHPDWTAFAKGTVEELQQAIGEEVCDA